LYYLRNQVEHSIETNTRSLARSLEQTFANQIDALDVALVVATGEIGRQLEARKINQQEINRYLENLTASLPYVDLVRATDERGDVIYGPGTLSPPSNVSDRDYFIRLRDDRNLGLFISEPLFGRIDKLWVWPIARRINKADGSFGGVIFARLKITEIERMLSEIKMESRGIIALRDKNFALIARYEVDGKNTVQTGDKKVSDPFREAFAKTPDEGTYETLATNSIDGVSRTYSYRRNPKYEFIISDGLDRNIALSQWRKQAVASSMFMLAFITLALILIWIDRKAWLHQQWEDKQRAADAQRLQQLLAKSQQVEAELSKSNALLGDSISSLAEGFVIFDENDRFVQCNEAYLNIYNASRDLRVPGASFEEIVRKGAERGQYQDAVGRIDDWVKERVRQHQAADGSQIEQVLSDGRCLLVIEYRTHSGFIAGNRIDITARKRAEEALRESERRFTDMLGNANLIAIMLDQKARLTYCNDYFLGVTGWRREDILNQNWFDLFIPPEEVQVKTVFASLLDSSPSSHFENEILTRSGARRLIRWNNSVLRSGTGEIIGAASLGEDITDRTRAEAERDSLEIRLRESQKMEAVGTLAGGIAHEFNNIIATVLGNAELALEDVSANPQAAKESVGEIVKAGKRARVLVQQILSFSRRHANERSSIILTPVVEESVRLLRRMLPARVAIDLRCADEVPPVLADANQIQQVIVNLVNNSVHAMKGKAGRIDISLDATVIDEVFAKAHPDLRVMYEKHPGHAVRLKVIDDGVGMDEITRTKIFEPFFTTKPVNEGTGLGLSVVHGIVLGHDGAIEVESEPGKGTTFILYLPTTNSTVTATVGNIKSVAASSSPIREKGLHVLYLDDDEALVFLVKRLLERQGYRVSTFTNQREALDALRADPAGFDLVLTDYNMPGMSGLDVAREVRSIRVGLPVAVTSGFIDEELRVQAAGAGVRELIFKAGDVEMFCEAVYRVVESIGVDGILRYTIEGGAERE
jgi:PAS domain S-box-containing protein